MNIDLELNTDVICWFHTVNRGRIMWRIDHVKPFLVDLVVRAFNVLSAFQLGLNLFCFICNGDCAFK